MKLNIETIPHSAQRYDTCGNWWTGPDGTIEIRVSDMDSPPFELAIVLHEIIEVALCLAANVSEASVDRFDEAYMGDGEPGDNPAAPYHKEHVVASICERAIAHCLNIDWNEYSKAIERL